MFPKLLVYPLSMFGGEFFTLLQYGNNQHCLSLLEPIFPTIWARIQFVNIGTSYPTFMFYSMCCHKCLQAAYAACKCPDKSIKWLCALSQHTAVQLGDLGFAAEGHGGVEFFLQDLQYPRYPIFTVRAQAIIVSAAD